MKKIGRAPIDLGREGARPSGPEGDAGRKTTFQSVGVVAATLLDQIRKKRDNGR